MTASRTWKPCSTWRAPSAAPTSHRLPPCSVAVIWRSACWWRSIPLLDQAALDAVSQWIFTPTLLNGTSVRVIMTVTVNFTLDGAGQTVQSAPGERRSPGAREFAFTRVPYPPEAVAAKIEGAVVLEAVIGVSGKVVSVKLADGPGLLAQSAIAAVRQWEFRSVTSPQTARIEIEYSLQDGKPVTSWAMRMTPQAPSGDGPSARRTLEPRECAWDLGPATVGC